MTDYHGLPCWYELAAKDLDGAHRFYSAVLGWSIDDSTMPGMTYHIAKAAAHRVAGTSILP
jgi:predicted enzyme related to lactoylglutathione lyase